MCSDCIQFCFSLLSCEFMLCARQGSTHRNRQNHCPGAAWASYQTGAGAPRKTSAGKAPPISVSRGWGVVQDGGQGLCRDNTCGKGFQAGEQPVPQPQGREERPCQWSQEEAQRERKEAGRDRKASGPVSMCRPQGSSWATQNNREAFSCNWHVLCAKMMLWFIFGKRQQRGVPSQVSSLPDMRGECAG